MSSLKSLITVFCLAALTQTALFGQCLAPDSLDIPNPLEDPDCSRNCVSNDLQIVGAFLDIPGPGCNACNAGDQVNAELFLSIKNSTGSIRTSFAIFGTIQKITLDGDTIICPISRCSGPIPGSTTLLKSYGFIPFTCGEQLALMDIILSWTDASPGSDCSNHDCEEISPKCGTASQIVITPPLQAVATATCVSGGTIDVNLTVMGGTGPFTYSWTGPGGSFSTEDLSGVAPGTYSVTVTAANGCTTTTTATTLDCEDGDACTIENCSKTTGCSSTPLNCDDGNPQSEDICEDGICEHTCDDSNACTVDTYEDGECVFTNVNCSDGEPCTLDGCNPSTGCTNTPFSCDDGNPESTDICNEDGTCTHVCDDGNICTVDTYDSGECIFTTTDCGDGEPCTLDGCDPATGCTNTPVNCDDGNPLSTDECVNGTCVHTCNDGNACTDDSYSNGNCIFTDLDCNDDDACTTNGCDPATGCANPPINCDDGNPQTVDDCVNGECTHTCNDGNLCTNDFLNGAGKCVFQEKNCGDGNTCTTDECDPATGACVNTPFSCDDGNPQSVDICNEDGTCTHLCDDGNPCTEDSYSNGNCIFTPIDCDDGNPQSTDVCEDGVCVHTCDDGEDDCTTGIYQNGVCIFTDNCDDGKFCTIDACENEECAHAPLCVDDNLCTDDVCREPGECLFVLVDCDDADFCTDDACNPANGQCVYSPTDCTDEFECTVDACITRCQHDFSACDTSNVVERACPPRILFVLDESGSIAGFGQGSVGVTSEVRTGSIGLLNALVGTNAQIAIVEFNTHARRAVVSGTTDFQTLNASTLPGFINYINDNNTTAEDSNFDPEDYLVNTQNSFTNWEGALKLVQQINSAEGKANLVIFFTDGLPTAYMTPSGSVVTGTSTAVVNTALSQATAAANGVKLQGSHIFVVGFPNPTLPEANVQAISGTQQFPDDQPVFILADYSIETSATLASSLTAIGNLICRADLRLAMQLSPSTACGGDTVTFTIAVTNDGYADADTVRVKDYIPSGYTFVSDDGGAATSVAGNVLTWNVGALAFTETKVLKIRMLVNTTGNFTNVAEVSYSNLGDNDSSPNNYNTKPGEDDGAAASVSFPNCSDGNACTEDFCLNGICAHTSISCNDQNPCTADACSPASGCTNTPLNCNDGNACTTDACDPSTGCSNTSIDCNDNVACTTDGCSPQTGCTHAPISNCCSTNADCNDGNACTSDACSAGSCSNTPMVCNDDNACTSDACSNGECVFTSLNCNDNIACTTDGCNTQSGCFHTPLPNCCATNSDCNDGNACTTDVCSSGSCANTPVSCNDNVSCTTDGCNPQTGCTFTPLPNCCSSNSDCNDGNACTTDVCSSGSCMNAHINCNDNDACTIDECSGGQCQHAPDPQCQSCVLEVTTLALINSSTDLVIKNLNATDTINLAVTPNVNVRAIVCNEPVGSVKFFLNNSLAKTESAAPYALAGDVNGDYNKWNVSPGLYTLKATPYSGSNGSGTMGVSKTVSLLIINQQVSGCTSNSQCNDNNSCTVDVCSNGSCFNNPVNCNDNDPCTADACSNGQCSHTPISGSPTYLKVVNPAKSWRKLKLGYSSTNLYSPKQNVTAGGNTTMCVTLRTVGTPEWNKIQIRPQGSTSSIVTLSNYISGSVGGFTTFCIPLSAFSGFNFSSVSFFEIPYSNGANAFEVHISKIEFTGGASPFLWFGDIKTDNYHDGASGSGSALIASLVQGSACGSLKMAEEVANPAPESAHITAYPNPFKDQLNFEFSITGDSEISLELFSITGAKIATIFEGKAEGSVIYHKSFSPVNLSTGFYIYRLRTNSEVITEKILHGR